jgi:hypothetical protein
MDNCQVTEFSLKSGQRGGRKSGVTSALDIIFVGQHIDETGPAGWIGEDVNADGIINLADAILISQNWTV